MSRWIATIITLVACLTVPVQADEPQSPATYSEIAQRTFEQIGLFRQSRSIDVIKGPATLLGAMETKEVVPDDELLKVARQLDGGLDVQWYQSKIYLGYRLDGDGTGESLPGFGSFWGRSRLSEELLNLAERLRDESKLDDARSCCFAGIVLAMADPFGSTLMRLSSAITTFGGDDNPLVSASQIEAIKSFLAQFKSRNVPTGDDLYDAVAALQAMIDSPKGTKESDLAARFLDQMTPCINPSSSIANEVGDVRLLWQFKCLAVASDDLASVDLLREYVEQLKKQTRDPVLLEWLKQVMMLPGDRPIMPSTQVIRSSNDIKPGKGPMD